jgi:hypothetical protein
LRRRFAGARVARDVERFPARPGRAAGLLEAFAFFDPAFGRGFADFPFFAFLGRRRDFVDRPATR